MPSTYSVMDMGYLDHGGGPRTAAGGQEHAHAGHSGTGGRSVRELTVGTDRRADRVVDLTARRGTIRLASGREVEGYTLNGGSPGPLIEVSQGDLLEVRLRNADVPDGVSLHWHGVDVPNAADGVAGVTQDAVLPGRSHVYRFVARDAGTYWYHSHQVSHEQVRRGLFGALVVHPRHGGGSQRDVVALAHTYDGIPTLDGRDSIRLRAEAGQRVRVRVVNSDNGPTRAWASAPFRVLAVDGTDVNAPTPVSGRAVVVTAGGRVDLEVIAPRDGPAVRVQVGASTSVLVGGEHDRVPDVPQPSTTVDLLSYGSPAPLGIDWTRPDRRFVYDIGRRPGFVKGRPGIWWTVNGHMYPHLPMYVVEEGDVVRWRITNSSGQVHPMHLHGHHAVVISRDGVRSTGSPWWFDSLNVEDGETYDVAFVADNPGIWMDHCHNLEHAREGLLTHLMYAGVTEPFRVGGPTSNEPE